MYKKIALFLLWLVLIVGIILYLSRHTADLKNILKVSLFNILALAFLNILTQVVNALRTKYLIGKVRVKLNLLESFHLANVNSVGNYLPFKGGAVAVAVYFKNTHDISFSSFANIVIGNHIIQLLTVSVFAILAITLQYLSTGVLYAELLWFFSAGFAILLAGSVVFIMVFSRDIFSKYPYLEKASKLTSGVNIILSDRVLLGKLFILNIASILIMGVRFMIAFSVVSFSAPLILSFLAGQVKMIAMLLNITPSGLGLAEFFSGAMSKITNNNMEIGIYAASFDRIVSLLFLILMFLFSSLAAFKTRRGAA